jgi:hypothetical protein
MLIAGVLVGALAVTATFLGIVWRYGGQSDAVEISAASPAIRPAAAFTVVYRVEDTAGPQARVQTDYLAVRRPFDVRLEHRDGPPPGGTVLAGSIVTRQSEITLGGSGDGLTTAHAPDMTPQVLSEPALRAAAIAGVARELGASSVLGQRCTRYAYRVLGTEPLAPPDDQERVETCVTGDDIMLREAITLAGRPVRVAQAVALDRSPSFGSDAFAAAHPTAPPSDEFSDQVTEGNPQGAITPLSVPLPPGFHLDRRASVGHSIGPATPPVLFYAQRFVSGAEEIVVQQPLVTELGSPWTGRGGMKLDLHNGRPSEILYHTGFVEVQTRMNGFPVRVMATREELAVNVAGSL